MADSIPSQCMFCSLPYYRQGLPDEYIMSYFCIYCRTKLNKRQWKLLSRFHVVFLDLEHNQAYWDRIATLHIPMEELFISRVALTKMVFEGLATKLPRERVFSQFQHTAIAQLFVDKILDFIELFEEYDAIIQEENNGQKRKISTD